MLGEQQQIKTNKEREHFSIGAPLHLQSEQLIHTLSISRCLRPPAAPGSEGRSVGAVCHTLWCHHCQSAPANGTR